jgi:hypothetical protein
MLTQTHFTDFNIRAFNFNDYENHCEAVRNIARHEATSRNEETSRTTTAGSG